MVVVSTGCEERCGTHVHKRLVRLSSYMSALTSTAGSSEYMKQQQLGELLTQGGRPKWRCDAFDRPWQHCWSAALVLLNLGCLWTGTIATAAGLAVATGAGVAGVALVTGSPVWQTAYLWVGGAGATTGLHNDDEDNVLLVLHGAKRVHLWAPSMRQHLAPNTKYDSGTECCDVDADMSEAETILRHPCYKGCSPPQVVTLVAGEALFIPRFWYHAVRSLSVSVSVNIFMSGPLAMLRWGPQRAVLEGLHALGCWRSNCVCHASS